MKVYVVTTGCYSSEAIRGIYTTRELADRARVLYASDNEIAEWELDQFPETQPGLLGWCVSRRAEGPWECRRESVVEAHSDRGFEPHAQICRNRPQPEGLGMAPSESYYLWARDEEHALKVASEQRAMVRASGLIEQKFAEQDAKGYPYNTDCVWIPLEGTT